MNTEDNQVQSPFLESVQNLLLGLTHKSEAPTEHIPEPPSCYRVWLVYSTLCPEVCSAGLGCPSFVVQTFWLPSLSRLLFGPPGCCTWSSSLLPLPHSSGGSGSGTLRTLPDVPASGCALPHSSNLRLYRRSSHFLSLFLSLSRLHPD